MSEAIIDGRVVEIRDGDTVLAAARRCGIEIPTLCHADGLNPEGGCRMCLVQVAGASRMSAACHTVLAGGMEIVTATPEIEAVRHTILSFYDDAGEQTGFNPGSVNRGHYRALAERYDVSLGESGRDESPLDESHPYLRFQPDACITCRLCLNACEQIQGQFVYSVANRGPNSRLVFGPSERFADSPCVGCGACVDVCPTGAINDHDRLIPPGEEGLVHTETICGYCGVGCRVDVGVSTSENRVHRIEGVKEAVVNRGHLCVKGRYAHAWHHASDRLTSPLLREGDGFREVTWDEALDFIARRIREIKAESGAASLGAFASSRSTNEASYLLQKLFRAVIGTNNVDCCARVCHSSTALALQLVTGTGAATASYVDLDRADCFVVAGANPTEAHPVVGARIKQRVLRGASLVVIDPRRIELAEYADIHLQLLPGTNVAMFNGLAKVLVEEGYANLDYVASRTEGFEELRDFLAGVELDAVASVTGVAVDLIVDAARLIGRSSPALFVHGLGLSELMQGVASVMTLCNLGMLTGSIGVPGGGMLPLRGQNNVQGSADMGNMPTHLTGYQPVGDAAVRERIGAIWGGLPPEEPGLTTIGMLRAAVEGTVRGLWLMGEDVVQSDPHEAEILKAMEALELVVVQDLFFSETCRYAHVILPSCGYLEQEGTFTNGERRIQHVRLAVTAPGVSRPDWEAVVEVANRLGAGWNYAEPAEVMDEIARVAPRLFGGVSYGRLDPDGLQWPCPTADHPGTSTVHVDGFLRGKGKLAVIEYQASPEHDVDGFPYLLITGRLLEHYNVGTQTRRTAQRELVDRDVLEIHPLDAAREKIGDGVTIRAASRWGEIEVEARHSSRVAPGTVFLSFHYPETHANRLTGPVVDPQSNCPQYKATAVRLSCNGNGSSIS